MKHFTYVLILFALNLNAQVSLDVVEKGYYTVYMNDSLISNHSKPMKAVSKSLELKAMYKTASVEVRQPNIVPVAEISFVNDSLILALQETINFQAQVINDVYVIEIPKLEAKIAYLDSLNRKKYDALQNRIETLQTFIKDSIAFISPIDYSLPIIKGFAYDTTGWLIDTTTDSYTYLDETDLRYIVFDFNRELIVGETYRISFDIVSNGNANFSIWLYAVDTETPPEGFTNSRVSDELTFTAGSHYFDYTVEHLNRNSLGFRARTLGWGFTISNIKIEKL
jgi:hypothetical protein